MTEGEQRRSIVLRQSIEQRVTSALQMRQPFPGDAGADVEGQEDVQRDLLKADHVDVLRDAVVAYLEVGGAEPGHDLAAVGHEHVHANRLALRRKRRLLRGRSATALPSSTATLAATNFVVIGNSESLAQVANQSIHASRRAQSRRPTRDRHVPGRRPGDSARARSRRARPPGPGLIRDPAQAQQRRLRGRRKLRRPFIRLAGLSSITERLELPPRNSCM